VGRPKLGGLFGVLLHLAESVIARWRAGRTIVGRRAWRAGCFPAGPEIEVAAALVIVWIVQEGSVFSVTGHLHGALRNQGSVDHGVDQGAIELWHRETCHEGARCRRRRAVEVGGVKVDIAPQGIVSIAHIGLVERGCGRVG